MSITKLPVCSHYSSVVISLAFFGRHSESFPEGRPIGSPDSGFIFAVGPARIRASMHLAALLVAALRSLPALSRSRQDQAIVELALRQQLAIYAHRHRRPRLSPLDRAFWVALTRLWPRWRTVLVVVQPETVVCWHRRRFRSYWRPISSPGPGRPAIPEETKDLIVRMAVEYGWRVRRIQGELSILGLRVGLATISRYLPKARPGPSQHQLWMTFLRNHRDLIAAMALSSLEARAERNPTAG